jgi:FAD-dependent urate hydroxylase
MKTTGESQALIMAAGIGVTAFLAGSREARGSLLVGADGIHSVVRQQLFGAEPLRYAGFTAWRAVTPVPAGVKLLAGECWGCGQEFGIVPLSHNRIYWFATRNVPEREEDMPSGRKQELLKLFQGWYPAIPALIQAAPQDAILRNDIYDRPPITAWSKGRVTLLGDAAHPMTPNLGQGACQALEDAVVLASNLRASGSIQQVLQTYQTTRLLISCWRPRLPSRSHASVRSRRGSRAGAIKPLHNRSA